MGYCTKHGEHTDNTAPGCPKCHGAGTFTINVDIGPSVMRVPDDDLILARARKCAFQTDAEIEDGPIYEGWLRAFARGWLRDRGEWPPTPPGPKE